MPRTPQRQTALSIDLGGEHVLLERVEALETLGQPFQITVDLIAPLGEIDLLPHLGKAAVIKLSEDDELLRYFHGVAVEGEYLKESPSGFHYRLLLRPWTHFLAHNRDFAIYQELDAVAIIKKVFAEAGASHVDYSRLSKQNYACRTYCVQYGESDFSFVSRLMEEEGIYYFFRHQADRHVLVLCDAPGSHQEGTPSKLTYNPTSLSVFNTDSAARTSKSRKHYLQSWMERVSTGGEAKFTMRDFDFTKPERPLEAKAEEGEDHPNDKQEVYDYPGGYETEADGRLASKAALEALRAERKVLTGQSQSSGLACGTKLKIADHPNDRFNTSYLITETFHSITAESYRTGGRDEEDDFNVMVEAIPADTPFRAAQTTPRPIVHGLESAIITGPEGEEIFTDEYGRVKVRFHWDRSCSPGEKSTCWMRVSQTGGLGNIILPRVGHEVLVDFLGGDPDRPVVVGRVFNQSHMPIYPLPDNKTIALWRTKRYGDTGSYPDTKALDTKEPGANELRFEDKGGQEEVFLHAERDMKTRVRFKETHHVGCDQELDIGHDRKETVGNDEKVDITGYQTETIGKDRKITVKGNDELDVTGKIKIKAGTTIEIEAGTSITLKVGTTTVKMDLTSIKMDGTTLNITGAGMAEIKAPMTTVKGDGMLVLKGGITMIN